MARSRSKEPAPLNCRQTWSGLNNLSGGFHTTNELKNVSNTIEGQGKSLSVTGIGFVLDNETSGTIEPRRIQWYTGPGDKNANLYINTGSTVLNAGTIESSANATLAVWDPLQNTGTVLAQEQELNLLGAVTGTGSDEISGTTLDFGSSVAPASPCRF